MEKLDACCSLRIVDNHWKGGGGGGGGGAGTVWCMEDGT